MIGPAPVSRTSESRAAGPVGISTLDGFGGGLLLAGAEGAADAAEPWSVEIAARASAAPPPEPPQAASGAARTSRTAAAHGRRTAVRGCGSTVVSPGGGPARQPGGALVSVCREGRDASTGTPRVRPRPHALRRSGPPVIL
ncbi:hypothetical protein GCM10009759_45720 [Kitasatospora saccharophila]|uniref:Uncharacterized protein n=1 Tax=Kitasatospora saccharophila TaxID=407973 RepID=A0ABN2X9U7_9ACTN